MLQLTCHVNRIDEGMPDYSMMGGAESSEGQYDKSSGDLSVTVHPTRNPTLLWKSLSKERKVTKISSLTNEKPKNPGFLRFVCISDTHCQTDELLLPEGDVLLHAGDFTHIGLRSEVEHFNSFLGKHKNRFRKIIVIAGNHDLSFELDNEKVKNKMKMFAPKKFESCDLNNFDPRELLVNCTYIEDEQVEVEGYRIYGSPWQPEFGGWAFNLKRGEEILEKWEKIPADTDILITHGPPLGYGDLCSSGQRAGCAELLSTVQRRVKPKFHIYGHIHEGYGIWTDGQTTFINASTCTLRYEPINPPIVFDLPVRYPLSNNN